MGLVGAAVLASGFGAAYFCGDGGGTMTTGGYANWARAGATAPDKKIPRPIADPMILAVMTDLFA